MKIRNLLITLFLLTSFISNYGQKKEEKPLKRIRLKECSLQTGFLAMEKETLSLEGWRKFALESELLKRPIDMYDATNGFFLLGTYNTIGSINIGVQFRNKRKKEFKNNLTFRFGLTYFSKSLIQGSLYKRSHIYSDTSTSAQGQKVYVDTVVTDSYSMSYDFEQILFNAAIILHYKPERRWSAFYGIGLSAGFSIISGTEIYHSRYSWEEIHYGDRILTITSHSNKDTTERETFISKQKAGLLFYVPLGIDFRLGNKNNFWKQIHLYCEAKSGYAMFSIHSLPSIKNFTIQNELGVRVVFN